MLDYYTRYRSQSTIFRISPLVNIEEKTTVNGLDLVVLAILSTMAIVIVGFAAKAYFILRNDCNRGHSLLEIKPLPPAAKEESFPF